MSSYIVRVYEDHYLVRQENSPVGTHAVELGKLEEAIALTPEKTVTKVKKTRKPRGPNKPKAEASPAQV